MDWLFHILIALIVYNPNLSLIWFLIGNVALDVFFIFSFLSVAGFKPRSLPSMLTYEDKASKTVWHKIGYIGHGIPAMVVFLLLFAFGNKAISSLAIGFVMHQTIDLITHRNEPNPLLYPFTMKKYPMGIISWSIMNYKQVFIGLIIACALLFIKYSLFGFIV